jgi:hypothetical protein
VFGRGDRTLAYRATDLNGNVAPVETVTFHNYGREDAPTAVEATGGSFR